MEGSTFAPARRRASGVAVLFLAGAAALASCALQLPEQVPEPPAGTAELAQLWVEPKDLEQRDLFYGIGGRKLAPDPNQIFEFDSNRKELSGFSAAFEAEDEHGHDWNVKLGPETHAEVLASRVIWAVGYHQPPTFHLGRWKMEREGETSAYPDARFRSFRGLERNGNWSWHQNAFLDTRPFRGLIVLMAVINNWDLTVENTGIYDLERPWDGARRWYVVRDSGASFSRNRGALLQGTRGDIEGFEQQGFIRGVENERVVFDWNGPHAELFENLSPADVRWICALLARIRPAQWDAAFRAAGYRPDEAARLKKRLDERIAQGRSLQ